MDKQTILYIVTFVGLYLEMAGAFMLSIEAIGHDNLLKVSGKIRQKRLLYFVVLIIIVAVVLLISRYTNILHLPAVIVMIISLGLIYDFAPKLIEIIINRFQKGTAGILGFVLFSIGFILQGYVSLSLLF